MDGGRRTPRGEGVPLGVTTPGTDASTGAVRRAMARERVVRQDWDWEHQFDRAMAWVPYVTLALSTVLVLAQPQSWAHRFGTLGLVALAAGWVLVAFTLRSAEWRSRALPMAVYFTGLLVAATLLMLREPLFFVFTITGFFHAFVLRPWYVSVLGVFATSVLINTIPLGWPDEATAEDIAGFLTIIAIQTVAIGGGTVVGTKITEQNAQRKKALEDLEQALEQNAGLQAQLLTQAREAGINEERQRMAGEIHDTLAQGLTGIVTQLQAAEQAADRPEEWRRHLDNAARLARESLSEARRSVGAMRPEALETAHLPEALSTVVQTWSSLNGVRAEVTTTGTPRPMHPEVEVALLRTAQEALANVAKHAHASRVGLTLSYMEDVVTLDVRDDGTGFEPGIAANDGGGFGLTGMRHRMNRLAGTLEIESEPGVGTAICASVPAIPTGPTDEP